ncbi:MAG: terpene cyclase/mutase family protein [Polyangiaceae bacterium]|nr:terpene cyclase/mutase family protein [Polyangiaceae bacterium]
MTTIAPEAELHVNPSLNRGLATLASLQLSDGHWAGDYGGPLFLMPGLLIALEVTGRRPTKHQRERMATYLSNVQREDGGWGLHVEDRSTMFGTAMNYVALRLLGVPADDPRAVRARKWIHTEGGAQRVPTWGKCWLSVLGVYEWEGVNPLLPELWLLPEKVPFHPSNFWCHTRAVFLPMSYLYGRKARAEETDVVRALRTELYREPYDKVDFRRCRNDVHPLDVYSPHTKLFDTMNEVLDRYERSHSRFMRKRALAKVMDHIHHEDMSTGYLDIGPVSKALHLACVWFENPKQQAVERHLDRVTDYLWDGRDGLKMQGYNGSQFWDLAFTMQAILEHPPLAEDPKAKVVLDRAYDWLERNQVRADVPERERYYRNPTIGCFPFSTAEQAWPVTDCTAEGVKVALKMEARTKRPLGARRLEQAIDSLLFEQNDDGGWSEYERARGPRWLEIFNAAEVFGDIMLGYSHVECTSACTQALLAFHERYPVYRAREVKKAVARGAEWLRQNQRPDGSFYASWAICFTYATWFGIEGLRAVDGGAADDRLIERAMDFLVAHQREGGGWGESYLSCVEKRWVDHERPQPVQTAWALLGLMSGFEHLHKRLPAIKRAVYSAAIASGVTYLQDTQTEDGWPFDMVYGVFNKNCMINYDNYRYYFPLWALARAARQERAR